MRRTGSRAVRVACAILCFGSGGPVACQGDSRHAPVVSTTMPSAGVSADENSPLRSSTATFLVHGMSCPLCANNVDKQLLAVMGVERVSVNLGTGKVTVRVSASNRPTRAQLAEAISNSGYTVVRIDEGGEVRAAALDEQAGPRSGKSGS
jgi:copper chaperone